MLLVNRHSLEQWATRIPRLVAAVTAAAQAGDPLARQIARPHHEDTLDAVITGVTQCAQPSVMPATEATAPARSALGLRVPPDPPEHG
jgi:hypothetical protein